MLKDSKAYSGFSVNDIPRTPPETSFLYSKKAKDR